MRLFVKIGWYFFGGIIMGIVWWFAGVIMFTSIIGKSYGKACFTICHFNFSPFGREIILQDEMNGNYKFPPDCMHKAGNRVWFITAGLWLALLHLFFSIINALTIFGIPSAHRHLQMVCVSFAPVGNELFTASEASDIKKKDAIYRVQKLRNEINDISIK